MRFRLHPELRALRVKNGSDMTTAPGEEALPLKMASDRSLATRYSREDSRASPRGINLIPEVLCLA